MLISTWNNSLVTGEHWVSSKADAITTDQPIGPSSETIWVPTFASCAHRSLWSFGDCVETWNSSFSWTGHTLRELVTALEILLGWNWTQTPQKFNSQNVIKITRNLWLLSKWSWNECTKGAKAPNIFFSQIQSLIAEQKVSRAQTKGVKKSNFMHWHTMLHIWQQSVWTMFPNLTKIVMFSCSEFHAKSNAI